MSEATDPFCQPAPHVPNPVPGGWGWFVVVALIVIEIATFVTYAKREIVWAYPGFYDQAGYLISAYEVERDTAQGLPEAVRTHWRKPHPTGVLLPLQGAVHGVILGSGRLSLLSVNFVHLALFQCVFVATILWLTRNWWIALCGFGLTLTLMTAFQPAGGAFDFRIDFASFCLFGVLLCALIRSDVLLDWRWSAVVGFVAAVLVLFRFITAVYLTGIFGSLCAVFALWWLAARDPESRRRAARRLRGWLIAAGILALVTGPVLYRQRNAIRAYYVVGHLTSSEKDIRANEHFHPLGAAYYYPHSVITQHTGPAFWPLAGLIGALGLVCRALARHEPRGELTKGVLLVAGVGFAIPFLVLNANGMKSPAVGIIFLPSILWAVLAPLIATTAVWNQHHGFLRAVAIATVLVGFGTQLNRAATPGIYARIGDGPQTMRLLDDIGDACEKRGLTDPELFVDAVAHELQGSAMQVAEYERRGRWRAYRDSGITIFAGEEEAHFERATRADVVVLAGQGPRGFKFPYDETMDKIRPRLLAYCDAHLLKIGEYQIGGRVVRTYVRGQMRLEGLTHDGWVTDQGITFTGTLADLKRCRRIELHRELLPNFLDRHLGVTAEVALGGDSPRPLVAFATADLGALCVDWDPVARPDETPVTIRIRCDGSFVPCDRGICADSRALVFYAGPRARAHLLTARPDAPR